MGKIKGAGALSVVSLEQIEQKIIFLRNQSVMLDKDIALLYGVKPIALRQQVKRNLDRFPEDFMFQLNNKEVEFLVSQNVIPSIKTLGGALPYVFTEQGVAMLSSVLKSQRAVQVNIQIMRAFTKLRRILASHEDLKRKIEEMEKKYDSQFKTVFAAIKELFTRAQEPQKTKQPIGFHVRNE